MLTGFRTYKKRAARRGRDARVLIRLSRVNVPRESPAPTAVRVNFAGGLRAAGPPPPLARPWPRALTPRRRRSRQLREEAARL